MEEKKNNDIEEVWGETLEDDDGYDEDGRPIIRIIYYCTKCDYHHGWAFKVCPNCKAVIKGWH